MKRMIVGMGLAMLVAGAAVSQPPAPPPPPHAAGGWNAEGFWRGAPESPRDRIRFLQDRIDRGMRDGSIDPREARRVNGELNGVRRWIQHMHWQDGGRMGPDQRARVQQRLDGISRQIHWLRHSGW